MTSGWNALLDGIVIGSCDGVTIGGVQCTGVGRGIVARTLAYRTCLHNGLVTVLERLYMEWLSGTDNNDYKKKSLFHERQSVFII